MVFTKLSVQEKDAFFGLLDEYFQSRPELFGQGGGGQGAGGLAGAGVSASAAASVVQRALATNATSSSSASSKSTHPPGLNNIDVGHAMTVGRVAAASLAFSQPQAGGASSQSKSTSAPSFSQIQQVASGLKPTGDGHGPPSLPWRTTSNAPVSATATAGTSGDPGSEVDKLITRKTSVFSAFKKQPTVGVAIPSAFVIPKNTFGPPPVRRVTSETSTGASTGGTGTGTTGATPRAGGVRVVPPPPRVAPEEEEVAQGEWAEVLYDYNSEDPGDLTIEAGMRVFVTEKTSEDWWTGQVEGQGREGLFPASYVKLV